jgi:hypothetical protein
MHLGSGYRASALRRLGPRHPGSWPSRGRKFTTTRRTRISIETEDRGRAAARPVAELMAVTLGGSRYKLEREVTGYCARVQAERASQQQLTDELADFKHSAAVDPRAAPGVVGAR